MSLRNTAERLTESIRKSFSQPPRRLVQGTKETVSLPGSNNRTLWVLSRYFLRQKVFELADGLTESKRKSALALLVRRWSPFVTTGFAAQWAGRRATVYAWDAAKANAAIVAAGLPPARCAIWPETFMREPLQEGVRLAAMVDGVEGQVWRQGFLAATRWWPATPPLSEWIAFLRAAGVDLQSLPSQPTVIDGPLLDMPWMAATAPITDFWSLIQNDRAAAIAAAVIAAPFVYLLSEASVLGIANARLDSAMGDLSQANQSIRQQRGDALADLDSIQRYLSLEPYPPQFQVIVAAEQLLRDKKLSVAEWTYDSGNLELLVHGENPLDATFYIQAFEGDPLFSNVTATTENQEHDLRLRMQVTPKTVGTS